MERWLKLRKRSSTITRRRRKKLKKSRRSDVSRFKKLGYASLISNRVEALQLFNV